MAELEWRASAQGAQGPGRRRKDRNGLGAEEAVGPVHRWKIVFNAALPGIRMYSAIIKPKEQPQKLLFACSSTMDKDK